MGVRQLVVAGGETSGACVQALNVHADEDRPADRPGCALVSCVVRCAGSEGLHITLKSGNFGTDAFFTKAFDQLA
jgi:uncharacterized protein YgbK (DUF1537 family)